MPLLSGKQILMVDDAADIRLTTRKVIEADGGLFAEADGVATGLEMARGSMPHLILLDLEMPGASGFDFLEARAQVPGLQSVPVIILSGLHDRTSVVRAISMGAADYLLKPYRASLLLQKIRKALQSRSFQGYVFPVGQRPEVGVTVSASMLSLSEAGILLESPLKLGEEAEVKISSSVLDSLGCAGAMTRTTRAPAHFGGSGRYLAELNLIGLNPGQVRGIRKFLKRS